MTDVQQKRMPPNGGALTPGALATRVMRQKKTQTQRRLATPDHLQLLKRHNPSWRPKKTQTITTDLRRGARQPPLTLSATLARPGPADEQIARLRSQG